MNQNLTFDQLPSLVAILSSEVFALKDLLIEIQANTINQKAPSTEELITIQQASELLHLSKATLYTKVSRNEIPSVCKRGKRLYFDKQSLIDWVKQGRVKTNAEVQQDAELYIANTKKGCKNGK